MVVILSFLSPFSVFLRREMLVRPEQRVVCWQLKGIKAPISLRPVALSLWFIRENLNSKGERDVENEISQQSFSQ